MKETKYWCDHCTKKEATLIECSLACDERLIAGDPCRTDRETQYFNIDLCGDCAKKALQKICEDDHKIGKEILKTKNHEKRS